ncbi:hypothetical protein [Nocardia nova]
MSEAAGWFARYEAAAGAGAVMRVARPELAALLGVDPAAGEAAVSAAARARHAADRAAEWGYTHVIYGPTAAVLVAVSADLAAAGYVQVGPLATAAACVSSGCGGCGRHLALEVRGSLDLAYAPDGCADITAAAARHGAAPYEMY